MSVRIIIAVMIPITITITMMVTVACGSSSDAGTTSGGAANGTSSASSASSSSSSSGSSSGTTSTSSTSSSSSGSSGASTSSSGSCDPDSLKTGIVAQQTGVSADAFDCQITQTSMKHAEPDPMIFKAIMYGESRFDKLATACANAPCGTPAGWTSAETGCYGLMQIVPACDKAGDPGMLPNGHPDLEKDPSAGDWAGSVFNPDVNIELGIAGIAGNRAQEVAKFPGCTVDQYTMMAIGDYANYGSTKSCTDVNHGYLDQLLTTYHQYATAAGYTAHAY